MMASSPSGSYVPYARRRNTPAQLDALIQLFEETPHPTRAQRQALANEIGMEPKSVTNWFQNRRQTSRRKSLSSNENIPPKTRSSRSPARHRPRRSDTPIDRSKISLDRIATLSERPSLTLQLSSTRLPLTPRKTNVRKRAASPSKLWTHMLSSPVVCPSSPEPEEARLAALSSQAKVFYPLEWACLKARQRKWDDEDAGPDPVLGCCQEVDGEDVDSGPLGQSTGKDSPFSRTQLEDVEAAITLLGFRMRS